MHIHLRVWNAREKSDLVQTFVRPSVKCHSNGTAGVMLPKLAAVSSVHQLLARSDYQTIWQHSDGEGGAILRGVEKKKKGGCCPQTIIDTRDRHSTRRIAMALLQCRVLLHAANFAMARQFLPCQALGNYFASRRIPHITNNKPFRDVNGSAIILGEQIL